MGNPPSNVYQQYQSKSIWVSSGNYLTDQTVSGSLRQLSRVQDASWSLNYPLQENRYLDGSMEPYYPTPTSVDVTIDWWHTNGRAEYYLGLARLNPQGQLTLGLDEEKSLYIAMEDTLGTDAIGAASSAPRTVIGMAQGLMTSYRLSASVGNFVRGQATLNCLTAFVYSGGSGQRAAGVNPQDGAQITGQFNLPVADIDYNPNSSDQYAVNKASALGSRELVMMFPAGSPFAVVYTGQQACYLQSMELGLNVQHQEVKPLGYVYPPGRGIIYPIPVELTTEAIVSKYQVDQLQRLACQAVTGYSIYTVVKQPCSNLTMFGFYFDDMQIEDQSFAGSIGTLDRVTTRWKGWLKSPSTTFFSPVFNYLINADTTGAYGTTW